MHLPANSGVAYVFFIIALYHSCRGRRKRRIDEDDPLQLRVLQIVAQALRQLPRQFEPQRIFEEEISDVVVEIVVLEIMGFGEQPLAVLDVFLV